MTEYYDFFRSTSTDMNEVTMDELTAEAMRTDIKFNTLAEELNFLRHSRITLKNELLTCYQYLQDKGLIELYQAYRDGEELPF